MRVFQFVKQVKANTKRFEEKYNYLLDKLTYNEMRELYLNDRFYSTHILTPILDFDWTSVNFTVWDYERLQVKWAEENDFKYKKIKDILYGQIESFQPEVIYNLQPANFSKEAIKNIPGNPLKICWFAAPSSATIDFSVYNARLTNFHVFLNEDIGCKNFYFSPVIDDKMNELSKNQNRDIDILFYGQYMPDHFKTRNKHIDQLINYKINSSNNIKIHLLCQITKGPLYNFPLIRRLKKQTFPEKKITNNCNQPIFGIDLYKQISRSKIVFNSHVDVAGKYRGNMRIYESLGCGALMISDEGIYPDGFKANTNFVTYNNFDDFIEKAEYYLEHVDERKQIAQRGRDDISKIYSGTKRWTRFVKICQSL